MRSELGQCLEFCLLIIVAVWLVHFTNLFCFQETSDLTFMIDGKAVHVHKSVLKIRWLYTLSLLLVITLKCIVLSKGLLSIYLYLREKRLLNLWQNLYTHLNSPFPQMWSHFCLVQCN